MKISLLKLLSICMYIIIAGSSIAYIKNYAQPFQLKNLIDSSHSAFHSLKLHQAKYANDNGNFIFFEVAQYSNLESLRKVASEIKKQLASVLNHKEIVAISETYIPVPVETGLKLRPLISQKQNQNLGIKGAKNLNLYISNNNSHGILFFVDQLNETEINSLNLKRRDLKLQGHNSYLIGSDVFQHEVRQQTLSDQKLIVPLIILFLFFFFWYFYQSAGVSFATILLLGQSYLLTFTAIVFIEGSISPFGNLALLLSLVMGVSDFIHFYQKWPHRDIAKPCLWTSVTTAVGFLALSFSNIKGIANFGMFAFIAIFSSFLLCFFIAPPLFRLWEITPKPRSHGISLFKFIFNFVQSKRIAIIATAAVIGLISLLTINSLTFSENLTEQFSPSHSMRKDFDYFKKELSFVGALDLIVKAPRDTFFSEKMKTHDSELKSLLLNTSLISHSLSLSNILEILKIQNVTTSAQIQSLDQLSYFSEFIPKLQNESKWTLFVNDLESIKLKELFESLSEGLLVLKKKYNTEYFWNGYTTARFQLMNSLQKEFIFSISFTLVGVFICFLLILKSIQLSILALIPNVFPIIIILSGYSLLGVSINFFLVILCCLLIGISVDDTIHLFYQLRIKKKNLKEALKEVTSPLIKTTFLLILLFSFFLLSKFQTFHQVAFTLALGFLLALICDLLLVPALLISTNRKPKAYVD